MFVDSRCLTHTTLSTSQAPDSIADTSSKTTSSAMAYRIICKRLTGAEIIKRALVRNLRCPESQVQHHGITLTVKSISSWESTAENVEFCEFLNRKATIRPLAFDEPSRTITLGPGDYMAVFEETFKHARDLTASIIPAPALHRGRVGVCGGRGNVGPKGGELRAILSIHDPNGFVLQKSSELVQLVFEDGLQSSLVRFD